MSTPVGDNTLQCDLKRDVLQSSQAVYMILEDDPQKCGVRDEVIDRVKTANDILLRNYTGPVRLHSATIKGDLGSTSKDLRPHPNLLAVSCDQSGHEQNERKPEKNVCAIQ